MSSVARLLLVVLCLAALSAGCGGDEDEGAGAAAGTTATQAAGTGGGDRGAADPRAAIQEYFTALRLGETERICSLESDTFETLKYETPGEACLKDAANTRAQPVWAEKTKVVSLEEAGDRASATVEPNAGGPAQAQIQLVRTDDGWLVDGLQ